MVYLYLRDMIGKKSSITTKWLILPFITVVLLGKLLVACNHESPALSSSGEEFSSYLDKRVPKLMDWYEIPGVSIVIVQNAEMAWSQAYGFADLESGRSMTTGTVCRVESISKSVTTWGAMKLVEEKRIDLDDPVYKYLKSWEFPESPYDESKITLRHLLSNQAGLPLGSIGAEYAPGEDKPNLKQSLSRHAVLMQEPGFGFFYSNVGFHLVELLIEDVTGRDFAEYMENEVLIPLEMQQASYHWRDSFDPPVPTGYDLDGNPVPVYVYSEKGSGGLFASAEGIANFMMAGMKGASGVSGSTISKSTVDQIYSPVVDISGIYSFVAESYGLGHFIDLLPDGKISVFSGGQGHGWMTHFQSVPETGDGIVILTNSQRSWPFISTVVKEWAEWNGIPSIGMRYIADAVKGIRIIIGGMILGLLITGWRLGQNIWSKHRRFAPFSNQKILLRMLQFLLFAVITGTLLWVESMDYFFMFSVFPVTSVWLTYTLLFTAFLFLIVSLFPPYTPTEERS